MPKQRLGKRISFDILESTAPPKPEHQKYRIIEKQNYRNIEIYNWKKNKTQVCLWLPDKLVEKLKIESIRRKKTFAALVTEKLTATIEK